VRAPRWQLIPGDPRLGRSSLRRGRADPQAGPPSRSRSGAGGVSWAEQNAEADGGPLAGFRVSFR